MQTTLDVAIATLPILMLFGGFLLFRLTAFKASLCALILEILVVLLYYHVPLLKTLESAVWGIGTIWSGFLVLYTGQIFGQTYRSTGLLAILLESVESILPAEDKQAKALALVVVIGGFIGAFNGFAVYPVTIPGLIELGFESAQAITAFLVYFGWTQPFVSLFIVPNISNVASHVPVVDIVRVAGLLAIPLVFLSLLGFVKRLGFDFFTRKTQILFWSLGLSYTAAIILFTQIFPDYAILMLIAGAGFSLAVLYVYGRATKTSADKPHQQSGAAKFRAYAPLGIGVAIVLATTIPAVKQALGHMAFGVEAWGYEAISINLVTAAGFFILVTALICYPFGTERANPLTDLWEATKRSRTSLSTLAVGSALVYLLVDTQQIQLLAKVLANGGKLVYATLSPTLEFLGGMAFGQGLPADFLLAKMQIPVAPLLGIPLAVLVGIVTVMSEGPPNALKPTQIAYTQALANISGKDSEIFRICLKWQLLQLLVATICAVALVLLWPTTG